MAFRWVCFASFAFKLILQKALKTGIKDCMAPDDGTGEGNSGDQVTNCCQGQCAQVVFLTIEAYGLTCEVDFCLGSSYHHFCIEAGRT
jgi:hypothetical protein